MNQKPKYDDVKLIHVSQNRQTQLYYITVLVSYNADTAQTHSIHISEVLYIIQNGISKTSFCQMTLALLTVVQFLLRDTGSKILSAPTV